VTTIESIISTLQKLKPELAKKYYVNSIGLFGSIVRDDFSDAKSDIDIIVDFSRPIGIEFVDLAEFLESQIKRKIDLVSRKGIKKNYYQQIESEIVYV
jgi:predicted nucleotidyltransferase